jgi:DNA-binding IclR family transcriptional regulator
MEPKVAQASSGRVSGTQAIHRAIKVLRCIARSRNEGVGLSGICRQTGLIKSTVHRLTSALISEGLVQQDDASRRYFLGAECHALGLVASDRFGLHKFAARPVARLARETGDAAFFSVRQDVHSLCLMREEGDYPLKSHVLLAGDQHPLGVGSGSQAMLAALSDAEVEYCLDQNAADLARLYPRYTRERLLDLVRQTREKGYALNPGLVLAGSWGLGVVVRGPDGQVLGALSIATVESRMNPEREAQLYQWLRREADALEKQAAANGPLRELVA